MPPSRKPGSAAALPAFIPPELATLTDKAPIGDGWVQEIKLDGYRTAARLEAGKVRNAHPQRPRSRAAAQEAIGRELN